MSPPWTQWQREPTLPRHLPKTALGIHLLAIPRRPPCLPCPRRDSKSDRVVEFPAWDKRRPALLGSPLYLPCCKLQLPPLCCWFSVLQRLAAVKCRCVGFQYINLAHMEGMLSDILDFFFRMVPVSRYQCSVVCPWPM